MSAIASFILLPKSALPGLNAAAVPKKRFFGTPRDKYEAYLAKHGMKAAEYHWSGYVLATLLVYLQEQHSIDLLHSDYDDLATFLTKTRGATHCFFTYAHRQAYLGLLNETYSEESLSAYYNEFNGSDQPESGKPMLAGIAAFGKCLSQVNQDSVILFSIS